jgi:hypothetical protein
MKEKKRVSTKEEAVEYVDRFFPGQLCPLSGLEHCKVLCPAYRPPYFVFDHTAQDFILTPGECSAPILVARNLLISRN